MAGLNNRITIRQQVAGRDSAGQRTTSWETLMRLWADVRFESGSEAIRGDKSTSTVRASVKVRRRDDIVAGMQLQYLAATLSIAAVLPDARDRMFMYLVCEGAR